MGRLCFVIFGTLYLPCKFEYETSSVYYALCVSLDYLGKMCCKCIFHSDGCCGL
jgi:hypothetical protein